MFVDIVVVAGDLTDIPAAAAESIASPLNDLNAPMGKYYVTGEYFLR